jgi:hypothetical protein
MPPIMHKILAESLRQRIVAIKQTNTSPARFMTMAEAGASYSGPLPLAKALESMDTYMQGYATLAIAAEPTRMVKHLSRVD